MEFRRLLIAAVNDTPLEHLLRSAQVRLSGSQNARYDRELEKVIRLALCPASNCVDVGVFRGEVLRQITKRAPQGKHFAFEPVLKNHAYLSRTFPQVAVLQMALSDHTGETTFQVVVGRESRSGLLRVEYPDPNQHVETIQVKVELLDNVIPTDLRIDLVKIDVEGGELGVMKGAQALILRCKPLILFEHGYERAATYGFKPEDIYDLLDSLGMSVTLMKRWISHEPPLSRSQFCDLLYHKLEFFFLAASATTQAAGSH